MICRAILSASVLAILLAAVPLVSAAAEPNTLSPEELDAGWILLFDGQTDYGWKAASQANWKVADGAISVSGGDPGLLCTTSEFADYELQVDFRSAAGSNSGIFLRTPEKPTDPAVDCYELNIADEGVSPFHTGSFVKRQKAAASARSTEWRTFRVKAVGGSFTVALNDRTVLDYLDSKPVERGRIGLQFNSGAVEFRNIKLRPLSLKDLFDGHDLAGWTVLPGKASVFSVTSAGELNVKNGNGALESHAQFGDFVLQLEIISNGPELNSGIFFRSIPGEFWQGYESQIHNGYKNNDRTQPKDCGTGGFYRRQNARKVVPNDREWFHETLVVSGNHMATWINGLQVSDWTDDRPPHENPRQGQRRKAGTLQIQGHDTTTDLSFKNLKIVELPAR